MMVLLSLITVPYRINSQLLSNDGITCSASSHLFLILSCSLPIPPVEQSASWSETLYCHGFSSKVSVCSLCWWETASPKRCVCFSICLFFMFMVSLRFSQLCQHVWSSDLALSHPSPFSLLLSWLSLGQEVPLHAERPQKDSRQWWSSQPARLLCEPQHGASQLCISYGGPLRQGLSQWFLGISQRGLGNALRKQ